MDTCFVPLRGNETDKTERSHYIFVFVIVITVHTSSSQVANKKSVENYTQY